MTRRSLSTSSDAPDSAAASATTAVTEPSDVARETALVSAALDSATPAALLAGAIDVEQAPRPLSVFDLMRIQRHRNKAGDEKVPNSWMAWLISRRDLELKPYEQPTKTGNFYDRIVTGNWYLPAPKSRN